MTQEDGGVHPLTTLVDIAIVVRGETVAKPARGATPTVVEDSIAAAGIDVWSVRTGSAPKPAGVPEAPTEKTPPARPAPPAPAARPPRPQPRRVEPAAVPPPPDEESRYSSLLPRVVLIVFALFVIGFVSWWLLQGRAKMGDEVASAPPTESVADDAPPTTPVDSALAAAVDTLAGAAHDTLAQEATATPSRPADTGGRTGGTVLVDPSNILVMDDLAARWENWYAIHISSFQESIRAREEVSFLQSREFPVFIVFLDLGPKGKWYRVYAGPFETREEARDVKRNLDAIPQIRFTRITRIPE
jgi:cell division septation protein DedD